MSQLSWSSGSYRTANASPARGIATRETVCFLLTSNGADPSVGVTLSVRAIRGLLLTVMPVSLTEMTSPVALAPASSSRLARLRPPNSPIALSSKSRL
jgi:hypothetical protein